MESIIFDEGVKNLRGVIIFEKLKNIEKYVTDRKISESYRFLEYTCPAPMYEGHLTSERASLRWGRNQ